jgi:hypothetical protein
MSRRRSAGEWRNNAFRSVSSDEDGGNPANVAASGSEQSNRARLCEQLKNQTSGSKDIGPYTSRSAS